MKKLLSGLLLAIVSISFVLANNSLPGDVPLTKQQRQAASTGSSAGGAKKTTQAKKTSASKKSTAKKSTKSSARTNSKKTNKKVTVTRASQKTAANKDKVVQVKKERNKTSAITNE